MSDFGKVKIWIEKVILSCKTWDQIITSEKLVNNFQKQMEIDNFDKMLLEPYLIDLQNLIHLQKKEIFQKTIVSNFN